MTDERPADRTDDGPSASRTDEPTEPQTGQPTGLEPWEVFRQEAEGEPMRHGGSILAPDRTLALHYARELYGRRQESVRLWVVRRGDIVVLDDPDLLQPPLDRSFKKPGGYVMREKLSAVRSRRGTASPTEAPADMPTEATVRPGPAEDAR